MLCRLRITVELFHTLKMIPNILAFLGLCFVQSTHQMNYQQALRLSRIKNITEFFEVANVEREGNRINLQEAFPNLGYSGDQVYVGAGFGRLASPDECGPRLTTVEIPRDTVNDVNVLLWPTCTRVRRCGGCCANKMLECIPKRSRPYPVTILRARLWDSSDPDLTMDWEGAMDIELEEHTECEIRCKITAADCNRRQQFDAFDCSCRCRRSRECLPTKRWDVKSCTCVCKDLDRQCRDSAVFNRRSCRCEINRNQTYSSLDVDEDLLLEEETPSTSTSSSTSTTTTTTTTTTTEATTADPCATQFCPPRFLKRPGEHGGCVCYPNFSAGFPGK